MCDREDMQRCVGEVARVRRVGKEDWSLARVKVRGERRIAGEGEEKIPQEKERRRVARWIKERRKRKRESGSRGREREEKKEEK
jgi:hypothetical protein